MGEKILILALGNDIMGDDIAGFLVADRLLEVLKDGCKDKVDVIKTSESGLKLIDYLINNYEYVIIVDSIVGDDIGEIVKIKFSRRNKFVSSSMHWIGIPDLIRLLKELGITPPPIEIYGIVISKPKLGNPVSDEVIDSVDRLVEIIRERIKEIIASS